MSRWVLVRRARQLLTLAGPPGARRGPALRDLGMIEDGAVLVRDGAIIEAGPSRRVEKLAPRSAVEIDARGRVVAPGFVDSHTHLVFARPRLTDYEMRIAGASYAEIAAAGGGILSSVRAVRETPASRLKQTAQAFLRKMAACGTTTVEAKSGYGLDEAAELKTLRVLKSLDVVPTYLGAHVCPSEFTADEYVDRVCTAVMRKARRLARFADIYIERGAFTVEQARRYLEAARGLGFGLKIHAEQFSVSGATRLAIEMGAVSADHLEYAGEEEIRLLAASDTVATLLPGSVFHLGSCRYAPARALIDAGAAVALATDFNPGTSPTYNMQMVLSLACTQMRMTPAEAISAATINGAHALRMADTVGSLEPGKRADLVVFDVADYREIPYYFGVNHAAVIMQRGAFVGQDHC